MNLPERPYLAGKRPCPLSDPDLSLIPTDFLFLVKSVYRRISISQIVKKKKLQLMKVPVSVVKLLRLVPVCKKFELTEVPASVLLLLLHFRPLENEHLS